jgi:hypothetical protein
MELSWMIEHKDKKQIRWLYRRFGKRWQWTPIPTAAKKFKTQAEARAWARLNRISLSEL